jgi:hypothetical protein
MIGSSQMIADERVEDATPEKQGANHDIGDVEHGITPRLGRMALAHRDSERDI